MFKCLLGNIIVGEIIHDFERFLSAKFRAKLDNKVHREQNSIMKKFNDLLSRRDRNCRDYNCRFHSDEKLARICPSK